MTARTEIAAPVSSLEVRSRLVEALKLDLVGPWAGHPLAEERLPGWVRPSNWYLTGFLIPSGTPPEKSADADEDEDFELVPETAGLAEESNEERRAAKKGFFPSSMGLSFLVSGQARGIGVTVRWGDYAPTPLEDADGKPLSSWQRQPREARVQVPLMGARDPVYDVSGSGGLQLHLIERLIVTETLAGQLPPDTRSVSVFLVNRRPPQKEAPDRAYAFQAELEVRGDRPFVPRPDLRGAQAAEWDERVADLHYADSPEYATGHGVSAEWETLDGACGLLRTAWIPTAEVEKTATVDMPGVELAMAALGALADGAAAEVVLAPLVGQYRAWIEGLGTLLATLQGTRRETAEELARLAGVAAERIARGIALLGRDAAALDAFRVANRAVARALRQRLSSENPRWRAFQLAFLLLNLPGLADPGDPDRATVDLLFFPTGGGKTEAYLGLAAFAMVLRRLRHPAERCRAGAGVSVIMRYTLRLLTLDQLARAAGLVCALELEREQDRARYGEWPFEIGLWVGKAATPNILGQRGDGRSDSARAKVTRFKNDPGHNPSPIPLENCPWCGTRFEPSSFALEPNSDRPTDLRIVCANFECDFTRDRALPIVASTATVRRAQDQVQALFARPLTQVFPPPGPDRRDSFFARVVPSSETPARRYLGIAAQGRNPKVVMRKAWLALMGAGERAYREAGGHRNEHNPADPYMTVLGYFNSLRELGGARRILEEEVQNTIKAYGVRKRIETFYRSVEVGSVTPFSARALDRGFAGALVGLARHALPELTPPQGVERIAEVRPALERRLLEVFLERVRRQPFADEEERAERLRSVQNRVADLLDSWREICEDYRADGVAMQYQRYELRQRKPLLREMLERDFESEHHRKFRANRSLRDVEPNVNLFLMDPSGVQVEDRP